jgi:hypothetical protein
MIPLITKAGGYVLKNRWTWYALGGLVVASVLFAYRGHLINLGKDKGREDQKQEVQSDSELARQAARAQAQQQISEANARAAEADARATRAQADAAMYAQRAQALAGAVADGRRQVASLPDAGLHTYVRQTLALSPEAQGPYTSVEERAIANAVRARSVRTASGAAPGPVEI